MPYQVTFLKKILEGEDVVFRLMPPRRGASYADRRLVAIWYELKARMERAEKMEKTMKMLVVTPDIDELELKDLELVLKQLKDAGYWVEEMDVPIAEDVLKMFDEKVNLARGELAKQLTKLLQEICPGVEVVFTDVQDAMPNGL